MIDPLVQAQNVQVEFHVEASLTVRLPNGMPLTVRVPLVTDVAAVNQSEHHGDTEAYLADVRMTVDRWARVLDEKLTVTLDGEIESVFVESRRDPLIDACAVLGSIGQS